MKEYVCVKEAYHAEPRAFEAIDEVGEVLGCSRNRDALFLAKLVKVALHAEIGLPVLAIRCTRSHQMFCKASCLTVLTCSACHCSEEVGVDLDDFLDGTRA